MSLTLIAILAVIVVLFTINPVHGFIRKRQAQAKLRKEEETRVREAERIERNKEEKEHAEYQEEKEERDFRLKNFLADAAIERAKEKVEREKAWAEEKAKREKEERISEMEKAIRRTLVEKEK